ncbi:hypothetical protein [Trinickia soli]|nr:hypothetical protein [Trinickia soli]
MFVSFVDIVDEWRWFFELLGGAALLALLIAVVCVVMASSID